MRYTIRSKAYFNTIKNSEMNYILLLLSILTACNSVSEIENRRLAARKELLETDIAMSNEALVNGFYTTLIAFGHDSLVKAEEGHHPIIGKQALKNKYEGKEDLMTLSWKPFKADASICGDMGYTLGNWTLKGRDTTYFGNYYTIWKKDTDGKWKWVADGGNNTPAPID